MLTQLTIRNYALIHHLELHPSPQLTVITGETGAGKSIMLGAVGLLLGNRSDTKVLWDDSEKCIAEATFDIKSYRMKNLFEEEDLDYADQTVIRREITNQGKSRAFINDTPVTLEVLRKIGGRLMDVHSQHETLELGSHRFQLALIDAFAGHTELLASVHEKWKKFQQSKKTFEDLLKESDRLKKEYDFIKFQLDEMEQASFEENEQEVLESGLKISEHGEDIKTRLNQLMTMLDQAESSVQSVLSDSINLLQPVRSYTPSFESISRRLESLRIELKDIVNEISGEEEKIEFNPEKTRELQSRLDLLYSLMQKHHVRDIRSLLEIQKNLSVQVQKTVSLDEDLSQSKKLMETVAMELEVLNGKLSMSRRKITAPLSDQLVKLLRDLGIPEAVLKIELNTTEAGPTGIDQAEILFSANKGIPPRPLEKVASGGEFSRVMFCVKYVLAEKTSIPTLILDEIDTGVSGEIAIQLGKMMRAMAKRHQLIAISHLPQIASRGHAHFLVYKDNSSKKTVSAVKELTSDERVEEIAKMIGGAKPSHLARENAKELLAG
ncbi:MAG TPA: DNA repair protein RecN [Cyclobacteriaceae bacterium]|nr:DNA repair protein RecN [Cyclobacteriaceae bacterium]